MANNNNGENRNNGVDRRYTGRLDISIPRSFMQAALENLPFRMEDLLFPVQLRFQRMLLGPPPRPPPRPGADINNNNLQQPEARGAGIPGEESGSSGVSSDSNIPRPSRRGDGVGRRENVTQSSASVRAQDIAIASPTANDQPEAQGHSYQLRSSAPSGTNNATPARRRITRRRRRTVVVMIRRRRTTVPTSQRNNRRGTVRRRGSGIPLFVPTAYPRQRQRGNNGRYNLRLDNGKTLNFYRESGTGR